jgi:hypothetical protein
MAPIPFRTPPPQGGHVLGQPFTLANLSIPVNCTLTCNCGAPTRTLPSWRVRRCSVPLCRKVYVVSFNPATGNQVMVASNHRYQGAVMKYLHIARYVSSTLWAITPEKMAELLEVLAFRAAGHTFSADEIRARIGDGGGSGGGATKRGGVAVIPIRGTIAHRMGGMDDSSGGTSAERIGAMLDQVAGDASIGTVVYDIDSPGGTVPGVQELAAKMFALRSSKMQIAQVNSLAASAAYWLASQADEIVSIPSGNAGSIGVFTAHQDLSKALEQAGVNVTLISAGKYKVEGESVRTAQRRGAGGHAGARRRRVRSVRERRGARPRRLADRRPRGLRPGTGARREGRAEGRPDRRDWHARGHDRPRHRRPVSEDPGDARVLLGAAPLAVKPRGRPRVGVDEPSADVHLTIPASLYDRAYAAATKAQISVPELIRRTLAANLGT